MSEHFCPPQLFVYCTCESLVLRHDLKQKFSYLCAESTATRPITDTAQRICNSNNNNNNKIIMAKSNNILTLMIIIVIQSNSYLFTCKLNSPEANYRVSTSKRKKQQNNNNNSIQFNSIQFFIFYVLSQQLQGQLQTQHSTEI
jgi:hypothetical protein